VFRRRKLRIPVAAASAAAVVIGLAAIPTASGALPSCVSLAGVQIPGVTCQASTTSSTTSSTPVPVPPTPVTPAPTTTPSPPTTTSTTTTTTSTSSSSHPTTQKQAPPPRPTGPSTTQRPSAHNGGSAGKQSGTGQTGKGKGTGKTKGHKPAATPTKPPPLRSSGGTPTASNPTFSFALPGAAPIGVPNFFIDSFRIPPFLIPIYQAAGIQYDIPWQILAGINEIETDYGRNLSVSSANAVGWMQFLPSTWKTWGVDANGDGVADPYNPVDAIFAAARYLHAAGGSTNLSQGIFAYNHASWYVQSVLLRAKLIGGMPDKLIGALTGLVQGHFPVAAKARYADDSVEKLATRRVRTANAALPVASTTSRSVSIYASQHAPVIAVNDGKIVQVGQSQSLGRFVKLQDETGNTYTYAHLGSVPKLYPVPKPVKLSAADLSKQLSLPALPSPKSPASAGQQQSAPTVSTKKATREAKTAPTLPHTTSTPTTTTASNAAAPLVKERLFAHPSRPGSYAAGGQLQLRNTRAQISSFQNYFSDALHLGKNQYTLEPLKAGAVVVAGTVLGRIGPGSSRQASHMQFMIQPAGKSAPQIDPKPILDGWKLLEATAVYRASGVDPFFGPGAKNPTIGQILLMSKEQLTNRILQDPHVQIYSCGRRDIQAGLIDRRVMATVEFLSASGLDPTVSGLECGHSLTGSSGTDAAGASGSSVDISRINNIPLLGHQGPGSIADITIRRLLTLQGAMKPDQIVSLMSYKGQNSTLALPDHNNRIQVTYTPLFGNNKKLSDEIKTILKPAQWIQLINRISQIPEPVVPITPSKYALRTAGAH
jgi:hypothetical protein